MNIPETRTPQHWRYFLALEEDVSHLSRFLEPEQANFAAYSLELARVLMAAASEVDVVAKQLCRRLVAKSNADSISQYREEILRAFPELATSNVSMPRFGLAFAPWAQWGDGQSPAWWDAYNAVKHRRHTHFPSANLQNALNAVSALFVLLLYFYEKEASEGGLVPSPQLFHVDAPFREDQLFYQSSVTVYLRTTSASG